MTHNSHSLAARRGVMACAGAFFIWGLFPLYLKPLQLVSALEISSWRCTMACVFAFAWLAQRGELHKARVALATPAVCWRLLCAVCLLGVNWLLYVWGVGHGQVLITSLGYFINPLVNVLLGVAVLSERLNPAQWLAVIIAGSGVMLITYASAQPPWIALGLAGTFSLYGLIRKTVAVEPLPGLAVETLLLAPVCAGYLAWLQFNDGSVLHHAFWPQLMLVVSGPLTAIPLVLFAFGARRINYATVGMLQYIGPSLQFLTGVLVYRESLSSTRLACFGLIWTALLIYAADSLWRSRKASVLG